MDVERLFIPFRYKRFLKKDGKIVTFNDLSPNIAKIEPWLFIKNHSIKEKINWLIKIMPKATFSLISSRISYISIRKNEKNPKKTINEDEFTNFINFASSIGVDRLGFTLLSSDLIFRKFGVLYPNVIVIIKEMDKNRIDKAPSRETQEMVMGTYKTMNFIGNKLAKYLRNKGFGAQAGPALGGVSNYVPLAEQAGLGWHGRHGLLITPEFGPRQRIALIYTSIENLPVKERSENEHKWIGDFCGKCGKCIKNCPGNAILEQPIAHNSNYLTHIQNDKCYPHFYGNYDCSICIKVCSFNQNEYENLKNR